ncbi:hypothetical protein XELAEV_18029190mg [Xenopus laevis]|uniref:Uncharacterized protein n=1 Tax=Xenopus laevis TaxID=8355 RepID=A0A974CRP4_XENLA|nr:hypothetical protein XELAEV_18029190mg [Xenopus laevis]
MDAVSMVIQLRDLTSNPQNRTSIVRDKSCLAGLILFLSHQDDCVVEFTLKKNKPCFLSTRCNKQAKTVTLYIQGLRDAEKKHLCEEALLKVKCVISFIFQIAMQRFTVRIYVPLHEINVTVERDPCLPDYFPDEVSHQKELDKAVIPTESKSNSQGSWINAAANFLSKTFFW